MYILSQDKKTLFPLDTGTLTITRNFGGGKKYAIITNGLVMGLYTEEKNAVDELEKILNAAEEGKITYTMN